MPETNNKQKSKPQKEQDLQALMQKEIQKMFPKLFEQYATQYGVNKTATHAHNGVDSIRLEQVNINGNVKYNFGVNMVPGGGTTFSFRAIPNMQKITLFGFAANNYPPPASATIRALINGHAAFGRCFELDEPGSLITPSSKITGVPITQGGNSVYLDSTSGANTRVSFSNENIVRVVDSTGTQIIYMTITDYSKGIITVEADLPSDWQAFFTIIMS